MNMENFYRAPIGTLLGPYSDYLYFPTTNLDYKLFDNKGFKLTLIEMF
jgi:hypothetical protein